MKKKGWIWLISIVGVLILVGAAIFVVRLVGANPAANVVEEESITVQKASEQEMKETILVSGQIVPESEQKIYLEPEKGEITEYMVEENQKVKAGDPLFTYDSSQLRRDFDRAVRERDLIQKRAQTEINQIAEMNKQIANAQKQSRTMADTEGEAVGVEDVNQLKNEKIQLELQYESTQGEILSAQEQINELDAQIKAMTVVSKIDGIVVKVNQNVAKTEMGASEPVVHIISSEPYKVIGTMSEFDAVKIKKKQPVIIRPKVFKDREWKGKVESVSQFPNEEGSSEGEFMGETGGAVTMYPFKVAITDDTKELRQGFHVSLEVDISEKGTSLVVPHVAVMDEEGLSVLYVLKDGVLERREIQTGKMNDEFIEVTEGVENGELVVLSPHEGMHDGMEVTSFDEVE